MKKVLILASLLLCLSWLAPVQAREVKQNAMVKITSKSDLDFLRANKIDVDRESSTFSKNEISVYATTEELAMLKKNGFAVNLVVDSRSKADRERGYYTYATLTTAMQDLQTTYPSLCKKISIGQSVNGKEMWALKISDNVGNEEAEPEFLYSSTMHGDEVTGMELMMKMASELLVKYQANNDTMKYLVDNTQIYIIPDFNPDGTASDSRYNANGVDLNRDFPERLTNDPNTTTGRAIETQNMMNWMKTRHFVLGGNFHGGAEVINYPWDDGVTGVYAASPDDANYIWLSRSYVDRNASMNVSNSEYNPGFGITNGAAWYAISGGMQDWLYSYYSQLHLTIELSQTKWPNYSEIAGYWTKNRNSLYWVLMATHKGVKGVVTNQTTGIPVPAIVRVNGIDKDFYANPNFGNYSRILKPGTYSLTFSAEGYESKTVNNVVVTDPAGQLSTATVLNVQLIPLVDTQAPLVISVTDTTAALNAPVLLKTQISEVNQISFVKAEYTINGVTNTVAMNLVTGNKGIFTYSGSIPAQSQPINGTVKILTKDNLNNEGQSSIHQISWRPEPITLLSEGFEGSFPPSSWTNSNPGWEQSTGEGHTGKCAKAKYSPVGVRTLTTPVLDLTNAIDQQLSFWWKDDDITKIAGHDTTFCEISVNGGSTWTKLKTLTAAAHETAYHQEVISLGTFSSNNVKIRWRDVTDASYSAYGTGLDDVLITKVPSSILAENLLVSTNGMISNYPNPFNPETVISFTLKNAATIKLSVYNTKGELISNLIEGQQTAGSHAVKFSGSNLNSGVYFYRLSIGSENVVGKMMLVK